LLSKLRAKATYANVVSSLCLVLVVGGGSAYAVTQIDANSVSSRQIVDGGVKLADLARANRTATRTVTISPPPSPDSVNPTIRHKTIYRDNAWRLQASCTRVGPSNTGVQISATPDAPNSYITHFENPEAPNGFGREVDPVPPDGLSTLAFSPITSGLHFYGAAPFALVSPQGSVNGTLSYGVNITPGTCTISLAAG
jgi:hypothetical protein